MAGKETLNKILQGILGRAVTSEQEQTFIQTGSISGNANTSGLTVEVTFSRPFGSPPKITFGTFRADNAGNLRVHMTAKSNTGFTARLFTSATSAIFVSADWIAIGERNIRG